MAELPENDRITGPFIAAAGQTDFPADFPLIRADGLRLRVKRGEAGWIVGPDGVAAVDQTGAGFTARAEVALEAGDRVWVYSELAPARLRQHTPNGAVRTDTLEGDAREAQAQIQELRRDLGRTIVVPVGELPPTGDDLVWLRDAAPTIQEAKEKSDAALAAVQGVDRRRGVWDAATNTPTLEAGVGEQGDYWVVSVAGARDVEPNPDPEAAPVSWAIGDRIQFADGAWVKVAGSAFDIAYVKDGVAATDRLSALEFMKATANPVPELLATVKQFNLVNPIDMGPDLQALLNVARDLRLPEFKITKVYYLNSPVTVPEDVKIIGVSGGGEEVNKAAFASATRLSLLVCGPNGRLHFSARSGMERMALMKATELQPPTTLAQALAVQAARAGKAVVIEHAPDVTIRDNYIVGFQFGVWTSEAERWTIENNKIDCTQPIYNTLTFDVGRAHNNHLWPFWSTHIDFDDGPFINAYTRDGAAIASAGPNDGCLYTNNLTFGYRDGIDFYTRDDLPIFTDPESPFYKPHNYGNKARGNWIDNVMDPWGETVTTGIRTRGDVRLLTISDNHVDQVTVGYDLQHAPGVRGFNGVIMTGNTAGACKYRFIRLGAGRGVIDGFVAGGSSGDYGIGVDSSAGDWIIDNIMMTDVANLETPGGQVTSIGTVNGAPTIAKLRVGTVICAGNINHDYRAWGSCVRVNRSGANYGYTSPDTPVVIQFSNKVLDSLGEFSTATGEVTATLVAPYHIDGCVGFETTETTPRAYNLALEVWTPATNTWTRNKLLFAGETTTPGLYACPFSCIVTPNAAGSKYRIVFTYGANCTVRGDNNITSMFFYRLAQSRD